MGARLEPWASRATEVVREHLVLDPRWIGFAVTTTLLIEPSEESSDERRPERG
jgi:hypothetical protein